jgi:hypothetical protein
LGLSSQDQLSPRRLLLDKRKTNNYRPGKVFGVSGRLHKIPSNACPLLSQLGPDGLGVRVRAGLHLDGYVAEAAQAAEAVLVVRRCQRLV